MSTTSTPPGPVKATDPAASSSLTWPWNDEAMPRHHARMIGRTAGLTALRDALADAREGLGGTVVVAGEAGIGKTRLVSEFTAGHDGALVLRGHCADAGSGPVPYAALTTLARSLADALGADAVRELAGPAAGVVDPLLPGSAGARVDAARLPDVLTDLLVALAGSRTLVVVLEDLHWSDGVTRALVTSLARTAPEVAMLVVLTVRDDDVDRRHPLRGVLTELERARLVTRLPLHRLTPDEVHAMARSLAHHDAADEQAPSATELDDVVTRSEGVPFYVEELTRFLGQELPDGLRDILLLRYAGLSRAAQQFCRTVAVAGPRIRHDLLTAMLAATGQDPADTDDAAREAVESLILEADDDGFAFRHALVHEAVYGELLPGERRRLHAAYASALEPLAPTVSRLCAVADHWWRARDVRRALDGAVRGLRAAVAAGASSTATELGERALELWDEVPPDARPDVTHPQLLVLVAEAAGWETKLQRELALLRQALDEWPADDPAGRAHVFGRLAYATDLAGEDGRDAYIAEGLRLLDPGEHPDARAMLLLAQARSAVLGGRSQAGIALSREAYDAAVAAGNREYQSRALCLVATAHAQQGDPVAFAEFEKAREVAGSEWAALKRYYTNTSDTYYLTGNYAEALRVAAEGAAHAQLVRAGWSTRAMVEGNVAEAWLALGRWDEAMRWYERTVPLLSPSVFAVYLHLWWTWLQLWSGRVDEAQAHARRKSAVWTRFGRFEAQIRTRSAVVQGELAIERGEPDAALRLVDDALALDCEVLPAYGMQLAVVAARALGAEGAERATPYREVLARCTDWPTYPVWAALFRAELGEGPWADVADAPGPAHLRPYALYREGARLLDAGDRGRAGELLRQAVAAAERIGAGLVSERAAELLDRAGLAEGAAASSSDLDALTARERQVLGLVAEGLTNGQIAERLFISPKTASVHVSAILRKLGVSSRTEAALLGARL